MLGQKIMAQFSHLPLFISTYDFIKLVYRLVGQFRKEYKYTLGAELETLIWQMLDEIIRTNSLPNDLKKAGIQKISLLFDQFKIRFRLAFELGLMTDKKFSLAQRLAGEIGKMIGGWQKWADIKSP